MGKGDRAMRKLILFLGGLFVFSPLSFANDFPFPGGVCPLKTGAQTWDENNGTLDLDTSHAIIGSFGGNKVGFKSSNILTNTYDSCGSAGRCEGDNDLIISEPPRFKIFSSGGGVWNPKFGDVITAGDYRGINIKNGRSVHFSGGIYNINELNITGTGSKLIIDGPTVINIHNLLLSDSSTIDVISKDPKDLIVVSHNSSSGASCSGDSDSANGSCGDIQLKTYNSALIYGHFFSQDEIDLELSSHVVGTLTAYDIDIEDNARLSANISGCGSPPPPVNTAPQFEVGTIPSNQCQISGGEVTCMIPFKNVYDVNKPKPLVFLMPTIDAEKTNKNESETEYPSSLRVVSVDYSQAIIKQQIARHSSEDRNVKFIDAPMQDIDYFIIEPGVIDIDGAVIVAGTTVSKTLTKATDKYKDMIGDDIKFSDFGLTHAFGGIPGVLVEPQTMNNRYSDDNKTKWMTGYAGHVTVNGFKLALDVSGVKNYSLANDEDVAFVAGLGSGYVNGKRFWLGSSETKGTSGSAKEKIFDPVIIGCRDGYTSIADAGFRTPPILVATKNSRNGGDGGWLRRCDVQKDKVAFIVEEDMDSDKERGHKSELAAFFMFETDIVTEHCDLFPSVVQTWDGASSSFLSISGTGLIENAFESKYVGYDSAMMGVSSTSCLAADGVTAQSCISDEMLSERLMLPATPLWQTPPPGAQPIPSPDASGVLHLPAGNYTNLIDNTGIYTKIIFAKGTYWFSSIQLSGAVELDVSHGSGITKINTGSIAISGDVTVNHTGSPDNLQIIASGPAVGTVSFSSNNEFNALILAELRVQIGGNTIVKGAVTSPLVTIFGNGKLIGQSSCFAPPPKDYTLKVTPKIDYSLTCERIPVTFTVEDDNGPVSGFNKYFSAVINAKDNGAACWSTSADKSVAADCAITGSTFVDGEKTLYLDSADLDVFDVTASSENLNETEQEHFEFVPFKFEVDTVQVIANKSQSFDINVLACNDGTPDVVQDYNGSKTLEVSSYTLDSPNPIEGIRTDLDLAGSINPGQIDLTFNQGVATTSLTYQEAGSVHFTLSDPSFTCPSGFDCNDYPVDSGLLSAAVKIESRPWKLAVCSDVAVDGNSSDGSAFVAAGEAFSLKVKPVRYGSSSECDLPITENFFKSSAPQALISALTPTLDSPLSSAGGTLGTLSPLLSFTNNTYAGSNSTSHYLFENMTYDEVGSIQFNIEAVSNGFYDSIKNGIDNGNKAIGRFYPAYFTITGTEWDYPAEQGSSDGTTVYMGQGFDTEFEVITYSRGGELTTNYGLFSSNLKADFVLTGTYSNRLNISSGDLDDTNWSGAVWTTPDFLNGVIWSRKSASALAGNITTKEDGPFNMSGNSNSVTTALGLKISGVDPVSFDTTPVIPAVTEQELLSQPDVRYGRMVLDSVGTAVGQSVTIPLRVEYWNGNSFVISDTDNATTFNGVHYCKQTIWPDPSSSSNSALSGANSGGIDSGVDRHNLEAIADSSNADLREQVRFWLKLTDDEASSNCSSGSPVDEQPWLQYNWRGQGDEDPSTVVTFGIYRGNDRVIFRGESNIIGTSN